MSYELIEFRLNYLFIKFDLLIELSLNLLRQWEKYYIHFLDLA